MDVKDSGSAINRLVSMLDEVEIIVVPSALMKTKYDFTTGWKAGVGAKQINMVLIHPIAVITPVSYEMAQLDTPSSNDRGQVCLLRGIIRGRVHLEQKERRNPI